jgi:prophage regulatory protein
MTDAKHFPSIPPKQSRSQWPEVQQSPITRSRSPKEILAITLPDIGFVRLKTVLRVFPVSRSSWWEGVRTHKYPPPVKLGPRTSAWKVEDIRALIAEAEAGVQSR